MASLRALLGVVLCSLMVSASEILPQADFDLQAGAGKWYLTGMCSNSKWFVCRKASIKSGTVTLEPTEDGGFKASFSFPTDNCLKIDMVASKTDVPGKFTYSIPFKGLATEMRVVDGKPDEYCLNHYINTGRNGTYVENKLYGRSLDLSAEVKEKFNQLCLQSGILPENIVHLPKTEECPQECFA
ncbi:lipocalin-like [Astatotilapia calliptera]|uniref:Lipocalin/cytosolic fatty-acid binding domain-containing protein n=1 Tax=Astatotilapia calliptera TaxID=8154 RepID=A0A3P8QMB3_ASTCA|nr:lipocalin-like [Astatotilapia calliptera]